MNVGDIEVASTANADLEVFLSDRLYEFNAATTGIYDGELLWAVVRDEAGRITAAISGHTWGGCCEIGKLWVREGDRGKGLGAALMAAAESEARRRNCRQMLLSTHSFQAPEFYLRLGFEPVAAIRDYPVGHAQIYLVKRLP